MTNYTKTMMESLAEVRGLQEDNMDLLRKAAKGAMQTIKFKDGKQKMDSFTASGIMGVYDKVNPKNKKAIENIINKGTVAQVLKLQSLAMKSAKGARREEVELDEAKNYEIKNGKIHISKANFRKVHKDYKNTTKGKERMMALDPKSGATTSYEVVFEEVELDEAKVDKKLALKVLSMMKNQKFVKVSGGMVPEIYLSNGDRDELKKQFGRLPRDFPKPNWGVPVVTMINHALGVDNEIDTEGGETSSPKLYDYRIGKVIGKPKTVGDAAKMAGLRLESVELDEKWTSSPSKISEKDFDSLKKGDTVTIEYKSAMSSGTGTFKVTAKNVVGKAKVEKATLQSTKNPRAVKHFLYKRGNKVSFAQGDMGAAVVSYKKEEVDLDEGTKQVLAHGGKGQYKVVKDGMLTKVKYKGKEISSGDFDRGAGGWFMNIKGEKGQHFFDDAQKMADYFAKNKITEAELDEILPLAVAAIAKSAASSKKERKKKEDVDLDEGTWQIPKTVNDLNPLFKLMKKPLKLGKEGEDAIKKIEKYYGDDELMDDLGAAGDKNPRGDARNILKTHMERIPWVKSQGGLKKFSNIDNPYREEVDQVAEQLARIKGNTPADHGRRGAVEDDIAREKEKKNPDKKLIKKLEEGKMKELHGYIQQGKTAEWIAKKMKLDVKTIKALIGSGADSRFISGGYSEGAAADARRAMRADPDMLQRGFSKDIKATDDDVKGASKNIIMQMRKAQSLSGNFPVEFADGKKVKIPKNLAVAVQQKFNALRRPAEKEKFQTRITKSYKDLLKVMKEEQQPKHESILDRIDRKIKENKNG